MKRERKSILEFLRSLFRKESAERGDLPVAPSEETVKRLVDRTLGETSAPDDEENPEEKNSGDTEDPVKESCPYATRRAIVESIAEIRRFAEEHELAASVLKALLSLLAEIALGALKGKVSRQILEALLRAINYEVAVDEAFKRGHKDGRDKLIEERYPADDDGLPHINGTILRPDGTSIFDVAAEAHN